MTITDDNSISNMEKGTAPGTTPKSNLKTFLPKKSNKVSPLPTETQILAPTQAAPKKRKLNKAARRKKRKEALGQVLSKVLDRAMTKSQKQIPQTKVQVIYRRLFKKIWAEVKELDFDISPERLETVHETIFKTICQKCCIRYKDLLDQLMLGLITTDNTIVLSFKETLSKPYEKPSMITRFFSSVGKAINKPLCAQSDTPKTGPEIGISEPEPEDLKEQDPDTAAKKEFVEQLIQDLLKLIVTEATYLFSTIDDFKDIYDILFQYTWAEVAEHNLYIHPEHLTKLHKYIFYDFCDNYCVLKDCVLLLLSSKDPKQIDRMINCIKHNLLETYDMKEHEAIDKCEECCRTCITFLENK